ncbi:MAG: PQQ-binding-like beta-propeller repeat protein [Proteobacteria bacterium]|nr:PQQ-binding-like beta-propeller repeat protein [Pseudomonadota bacterium]
MFTVVVTNSAGSITSNGAKLTVTGSAPQPSDVVMYKNDVARTGQYPLETTLTPANVNATNFGLLRQMSVDGKVDGQPLYLSKLSIGGAAHNVVFAVTENASVYAFDSDTGTKLWEVSLLKTGETAAPPQNACDQITPTIGITTTPVIDRTAGPNGTLYVVAMSFDATSKYHQRLHALDITTGAELLSGPTEVTGSYPNQAGVTTFDPGQYAERTALLLLNGALYTTWTSHCDNPPYSGWIITFDQGTLAQSAVLNVGPDSGILPAPDIPPALQNDTSINGPAIWMSGSGPAADSAGNVYLLTGNGRFETTLDANGFPNRGDYGNSFLKLSKSGSTLKVADYFTQTDSLQASFNDLDLGAGGGLILPDMKDSNGNVKHLIVGAGKDTRVYVVDRDNMGKFSPTTNNIWQQLGAGALGGPVRGSPAYFNGTLYYGPRDVSLKAFTFANAKLPAAATSQSVATFGYPGTSPVISSNGAAQGIVWTQHSNGTLYAFDATNLAHELYDSRQATGNRDVTGPGAAGSGLKFVVPVIANGKVFMGTPNSVAVFGLLH